MEQINIGDLHRLRAAEGWLELGNTAEAKLELEAVSSAIQSHPAAMELRWLIGCKEHKWDACRDIAQAITKAAPALPSGWIHFAYAARRASGGGVQAAWDILQSVAAKFPKEPIIPFNLACYACQLGNLDEASRWLKRAFDAGDAKHLKVMALAEEDLRPLWKEIENLP